VKPETPVTATGPSSGEIGAMLKMCQVCLPPARCNKVRAPSSAAQSEGEASSCRGSPDVRWRLVVQVRGRATIADYIVALEQQQGRPIQLDHNKWICGFECAGHRSHTYILNLVHTYHRTRPVHGVHSCRSWICLSSSWIP
jgi:hypothetical protein